MNEASAGTRDLAAAAGKDSLRSLGMMVFLASEAMLFAGMFTIYAASRIRHPQEFADGVEHNLRWVGTANTYVLLSSSWCIAVAVVRLRSGSRRTALALMAATMMLGLLFLGLKATEYRWHLSAGDGPEAVAHHDPGIALFMVLYWLMTGTHALHVIAGLILLGYVAWRVARRQADEHLLEAAAWYWHLVDLVWVFLWPLFYLLGRVSR
jgi:cytochrome c oxidase subunit 3